jgi:hypothetical protein
MEREAAGAVERQRVVCVCWSSARVHRLAALAAQVQVAGQVLAEHCEHVHRQQQRACGISVDGGSTADSSARTTGSMGGGGGSGGGVAAAQGAGPQLDPGQGCDWDFSAAVEPVLGRVALLHELLAAAAAADQA